ncbi:MAG: 2-dehydro-3-deoxyglucarate aldolase [Thermogutta sp.]|uniref:HpcH/HpaI aldolase family protein n=1 Tax=Thermogutta sp. TaxID=1962930 RepID=UPI00198C217B|nr:aldolase/citrate lyase family protein [Thermogutta sp.]MBC7353454.1 2-dehydro-3-deoxyglucarate aldolase [Thermogutta sp.]
MRSNAVKSKILKGQVAWGTWITSGNYYITRALLSLGFDWLTVDMEHAAVDWSDVARLVGAIADNNVVPFIRVPEGTPFYLKRALDTGAFGIIVPRVETPEVAQQIVRGTRFPPDGNRSAGGALHFLHFAATLEEYLARANQEIMVVLQIESPRGVQNCAAIASVAGFDALLVGPLDLETRLRAESPAGDVSHAFAEHVRKVIGAGERFGRITGIHARSPEEARFWAEQGMRLIAVGTDIGMLTERAREYVAALSGATPGRES